MTFIASLIEIHELEIESCYTTFKFAKIILLLEYIFLHNKEQIYLYNFCSGWSRIKFVRSLRYCCHSFTLCNMATSLHILQSRRSLSDRTKMRFLLDLIYNFLTPLYLFYIS